MSKLQLQNGFREIYKFDLNATGWQEVGDTLQRKAVLVSSNEDRFETVIVPKGYVGRVDNVPVDVNHTRQHSGAYLSNIQVENDVEVPWINGETRKLKNALTGIFVIPKTARWYYTDRDGKINDNGSLWELAKENRLIAPSVDFVSINTRMIDGVLHYLKWDLTRCSLLTVAPGQQDSGWIRSLIENTVQPNVLKSKLEFLENELNTLRSCYCLFDKDNILDYTKYKLPFRKLVGSEALTDLELLNSAMQEVLAGDLTVVERQDAYDILKREYQKLGIDENNIPKFTMPDILEIIKAETKTEPVIQSIVTSFTSEGKPMVATLSVDGESYKLDKIEPLETEVEVEAETPETPEMDTEREIDKTKQPDMMGELKRMAEELSQRLYKLENPTRSEPEPEQTPEPESEQEPETQTDEAEAEQLKETIRQAEDNIPELKSTDSLVINSRLDDYINIITTK